VSSSSGAGRSEFVSGGSSLSGTGGDVPSGDSICGISGAELISSGSGDAISVAQGNSRGSSIGSDVLVQRGSVDSASAAQSLKDHFVFERAKPRRRGGWRVVWWCGERIGRCDEWRRRKG